MDSIKKLAKGAGYAFLGYIISKFLGYLYRVLIARIDPQSYGEFSIVIAIFSILSLFSLAGFNVGVTRYVSFYCAKKDTEKTKAIIYSALIIGLSLSLLSAIIIFSLSNYLAELYQLPSIALLFKIMAVAIPFYVARDILLAVSRGFQFAEYEVFTRMITENLLKVIISYILVSFGLAVIGAAIANVVSIVISALLALYFVEWHIFPFLHKFSIDKQVTKELFFYSIPVLFTTLITQVFVWSGTLVMSFFKSIEEVGIYNTAIPTATLLSIIPGGIITLFLPVMTELYVKNDNNSFVQTYKSCAKWIFFVTIPLFLFMFFFSKEILTLVFGAVYSSGGLALSILAIGYLVYHPLSPSVEILTATKKTHIILINTIVAAIVNILLNLLLIPHYGMIGGAFAITSSMIFLGVLAYAEGIFYEHIQPFQWSYLKALFAGIASIFITFWIFPSLPEKLIYSIPIAFGINCISYGIIMLLLKAYDKVDLFLFQLIKNRAHKIILHDKPIEE